MKKKGELGRMASHPPRPAKHPSPFRVVFSKMGFCLWAADRSLPRCRVERNPLFRFWVWTRMDHRVVVPPLGAIPPKGGTTSQFFTSLVPRTGIAKKLCQAGGSAMS